MKKLLTHVCDSSNNGHWPRVVESSQEVKLIELEAEVQLPDVAGVDGPGEVAPEEAGGGVHVPGEEADWRLVAVQLPAASVLQEVVTKRWSRRV